MELELANHIKDLDNRFYGLTLKDVMSLAFQFAELNGIKHRFNKEKKAAGRHWTRDFALRNGLSVRNPEKCSVARAIGFNRVQCQRFFDNLKTCFVKTQAGPHRIFNMDETGMSTVPNKLPKILSSKGKKCVAKVVSAERGQLVTAVCCVNATGIWVPPALIFARKRMKEELFYGAPPGTLKLISDSGYMNTELFIEWLRHFQSHVKSTTDDPVILILDNHISHCSLQAVTFCRDHSITLLSLPPHASHKMQPLDKGFFAPLKSAFSLECDKWMVTNPGRVVTIKQMAALFHSAYSKVATTRIAEKSFEATGLFPYNPDVFEDADFAPSEVTNRHKPASDEDSDDDVPLSHLVAKWSSNSNYKEQALPNEEQCSGKKHTIHENIQPEPSTSKVSNLQHQIQKEETTPTKKNHQEPIADKRNDCQPSKLLGSKIISFTPKMIIPLPEAKHVQTRKTKAKKSEILSSTPYKDGLLQSLERDTSKGVKRRVCPKPNEEAPKKFKKSSKDMQLSTSEDDVICPGCEENYKTSDTSSGDWLKCNKCQIWWHELCSNYLGQGQFLCDTCLY